MLKSYVELMSWIPRALPEPQPRGAAEDAVLAILRESDRDLGSEDVVRQMTGQGFSRSTAYRAITRLIDTGTVTATDGRTKWRRLKCETSTVS